MAKNTTGTRWIRQRETGLQKGKISLKMIKENLWRDETNAKVKRSNI